LNTFSFSSGVAERMKVENLVISILYYRVIVLLEH